MRTAEKLAKYDLAVSERRPSLFVMLSVRLAPSQNEVEFGNESLVGEWASFLPEVLSQPQRSPWCLYTVLLENRVVGLGGFKSKPDDNDSVELSYLTCQPERRRGIATAICSELISIARAANVSKIVAHTLPEENASTAVLRANDFVFVGAVDDPDDGCVWKWSLSLNPK